MSGNREEQYQSIFVSNLPSSILSQDVKPTLLRHFRTFGGVERISIRRGTAHLQFSSAVEAANAQNKGCLMKIEGQTSRLVIKLTSKNPTTQRLNNNNINRLPLLEERSYNRAQTSSSSPQQEQEAQQAQRSVKSYFQQGQRKLPCSPRAAARENNSYDDELKPKQLFQEQKLNSAEKAWLGDEDDSHARVSQMSTQQISTSTSDDVRNEIQNNNNNNTCLKLEPYDGSAAAPSQLHPEQAKSDTISPNANLIQNQGPSIGPLQSILNLDVSGMPKIPTASANPSFIVACQALAPNKESVNLPMMFGKINVSPVLPIKSVMDQIQPGLPITDETIFCVWNTICDHVCKSSVQRLAQQVYEQEKANKESERVYEELEDQVIEGIMMSVAGREFDREEKTLTYCEDALDNMIGEISNVLLREVAQKQLTCEKEGIAVTPKIPLVYEALEKQAINKLVVKEARNEFFHELAQEVVDDFLESSHFNGIVNDVLRESCQAYLAEASEQRLTGILNSNDIAISENVGEEQIGEVQATQMLESAGPMPLEVRDEFLYNLCQGKVDGLFEDEHFYRIIKVVVKESFKTYSSDVSGQRDTECSNSSMKVIPESGSDGNDQAVQELRSREKSPEKQSGLIASWKRKATESMFGWSMRLFKRAKRDSNTE